VKRGKILIIRGGAIGDFILTLPALSALRANFPESHLELLAYPALAELSRAAGLVDAFRSIEARPLARFFARGAELDLEWSSYFESFHVIISYLFDPDEIFKTNVLRCSATQFIQGPHRPSEAHSTHATAVFLQPLGNFAVFDADPIPRLTLPPTAGPLGGDWLAVHPGSGSEKKNWPEPRWLAALQTLLREAPIQILLVGGEAEGDRLEHLHAALPVGQVGLAQNLPLAQLAARLAQCRAFAGHDSGITHLAAALGLPSLALWGPSNPQIWRPLHPGTRLLHPPNGLGELAVPEVVQHLKELLAAG